MSPKKRFRKKPVLVIQERIIEPQRPNAQMDVRDEHNSSAFAMPAAIAIISASQESDELDMNEKELLALDAGKRKKWSREIPIDRLESNPHQAREIFDLERLQELANGMEEHGWVGGGIPVRPHPTEPNTYQLVFGERRWRAAKLAGLKSIPCEVSEYIDNDLIEIGLIENIQRENLTNLEEGKIYQKLLELQDGTGKARYSIRKLAQRIGKDKSYVEDRLQYVRVPEDIQQLVVDQPEVSPRIVRELGEIAKILKVEERQSVIEGVRKGELRIEDVREIRKDAQEQAKAAAAASVATATITKAQPEKTQLNSSGVVNTEQLADSAPTPPVQKQEPAMLNSPRGAAIVVSVFEKTLKRDNETVERIFQRLSAATEQLTENEQDVFHQCLQQWDTTIQQLLTNLE